MSAPAIWHDVECGSYDADLPLWEELAATVGERSADVLDLGCGTGRVAVYLAKRGNRVAALDRDELLLAELRHRLATRELPIEVVHADARSFELGRRFDAVFAPMQLAQLLRGTTQRRAMLAATARHLRPGGVFAAALMDLEGEVVGDEYAPPMPDMREIEQWVYCSQPVAIRPIERGHAISLERVRTTVSPEGDQEVTQARERLELVPPEKLEDEARAEGLMVAERRIIPPTDEHVGSVVVVASAPEAR
jgi:SAM-dependent methyltransferase